MIDPTHDTTVAERIADLRRTVPTHVRLIAVTKQVPVALMRQAYAAGIRDFGESRVQEAIDKRDQLQDLSGITWHLIGHLQRNKVKLALETFSWIHSVDSLALAQRLDRLAGGLHKQPRVCLQVKIVADPNKYGWSVEELKADLPALQTCENLQIRGLMTILPLGLDQQQALDIFRQTQQLATEIGQQTDLNLPMQELSMGMSGDYLLAVQAGATMVRLGRILFGDRPAQGSP